MQPLEAVQPSSAVNSGLEKGALLVPAGHARHHLGQVGHPGVFFRLGKTGQAHPGSIGEGKNGLLGQADIKEDAAEIAEIKGGGEHAHRSFAFAQNGLDELDHHPPLGGQQGVVADHKAVVGDSVLKLGDSAQTRRQRFRRGGQDVPLGIGEHQGDIGRVAGQHVGQQRTAGSGIKRADLGRLGQGHEQQPGVVHHPLMLGSHGLNLVQGEVLGVSHHLVAQFAAGVEDDRQCRQHRQQDQQDQLAADGGEDSERHGILLGFGVGGRRFSPPDAGSRPRPCRCGSAPANRRSASPGCRPPTRRSPDGSPRADCRTPNQCR